MATTVDDLVAGGTRSRVFVDTNVLVYSTVKSGPFHLEAKAAVDALSRGGAEQWLSFQILREYLSAMTRLPAVPLPGILKNIRKYRRSFRLASDSNLVHDELLALLISIPCGGKQVHDANIVATMLVNGVPNLLTHNVADFTRFDKLITILPLVP